MMEKQYLTVPSLMATPISPSISPLSVASKSPSPVMRYVVELLEKDLATKAAELNRSRDQLAQLTQILGADPSGISPGSSPQRMERYRLENAATNLKYKTSMCRHFATRGDCPLGIDCQFAHGQDELRTINDHPCYKTKICKYKDRTSCPYGPSCYYYHQEQERRAFPDDPLSQLLSRAKSRDVDVFMDEEFESLWEPVCESILYLTPSTADSSSE